MKKIKRLLSLFLCITGLYSFGSCLSKNDVKAALMESDTVVKEPAEDVSCSGVTRFLVLGKDRKAGLTDSIFLVSVKENAGEVGILQIPRDTYLNYTDKDYKKINAAYKTLGMQKMKQMLSTALGVSIDYCLVVNLDVIPEVVDAVGGVEVELAADLDFINEAQGINVHLPAGKNTLTGSTAEYYLRYRSGYVNADLGRMDAQKQFLQNLTTAAQSLKMTEQIALAVKVLPKLKTDFTVVKAISLLKALSGAELSDIPMATAPGTPVKGKSGAWYYSLNRQKMLQAVNTYCLPETPILDETFDPDRVFDRTDHENFHKIYTASGK